MTTLDFSRLKEFADDNFRFDDNGRDFSKTGRKHCRKGEMACYEQLLLFASVFKRYVLQTGQKQGLFGKGLCYSEQYIYIPYGGKHYGKRRKC